MRNTAGINKQVSQQIIQYWKQTKANKGAEKRGSVILVLFGAGQVKCLTEGQSACALE